MRKMYWSTEEVPAEEFNRRLRAWLCEPSHLTCSVKFDARSGLLRCTFTHLVTPDDGERTELVRQFTCPATEVANALRTVPGQGQGVPQVGDPTCGPVEGQFRGDDPDPETLALFAKEEDEVF